MKLRSWFRGVYDYLSGVAITLEVLALVAGIFFLLKELAPLITILFVAVGTIGALGRLTTAALSIGGIALYAISWPMVESWGLLWPGLLVCSFGILAWLIALGMAIRDAFPDRNHVTQ